MFWILLLTITFLTILYEIQFRWKYRSLNRFPGPICVPLIGASYYLFYYKSLMGALSYLSNISSITKISIGHDMLLIISDSDMFDFFLRSPKFVNKPKEYKYLAPWVGRDGVFVGNGKEWENKRKLYVKAAGVCHVSYMEKYLEMFSFHSDVLINVLRELADSSPVDIYPIVVNYSLDVVSDTALGINTNYQRKYIKKYVHGLHIMARMLEDRFFSAWKRFDFLYKLSPAYKTQQKYSKIVSDVSNKAIENRRKIPSEKLSEETILSDLNSDRSKRYIYFIDLLLNSTIDDKPLSDDTIRTELNSVILAGYDTIATAISIMMYALASYKEVQDKIVKELKGIFGDDRDRRATMQDLGEMKYMELVIKESMRFYSVVPFIGRKTTENVEYKGTIIPEGTILVFFMHGVHRSSTYDRPEEFIPERFLPTNYIKPYSFVPFSAGPRNCIGQKFAMVEMKETFSKLLRNLEFESAGPDYKMDLEPDLVMKPVNGIYVKIKPRVF